MHDPGEVRGSPWEVAESCAGPIPSPWRTHQVERAPVTVLGKLLARTSLRGSKRIQNADAVAHAAIAAKSNATYVAYNAARAFVLERNLSCRPCSVAGGLECPMGHHLCMQEIQPDAVYTALCRALA